MSPRFHSGGTRRERDASQRLLIFEDRHWRALRPLTDLVPVPALTFGAANLAERWRAWSGLPLLAIEARRAAMSAWRAAPGSEATRMQSADEVLVVNAAALPGAWLESVHGAKAPSLHLLEGRVAAARLPFETLAPGLGLGEGFEAFLLGLGLPRHTVEVRLIAYPWNLAEWNAEAVELDLEGREPMVAGEVHRLASLEARERIRIEAGARIDAFAVLDARNGPISIHRGARICAHTVVTGPCVVGELTQLMGGSIARSSFGSQCRIAGEVEASVWQGFANKRHHGFVGHSAISEWVNLGALTTTSDLKNNYGTVRVWVDGREVDSRSRKVGAVVGAHVKTGIGTLLPTGASIGVGANLFGGGRFAPKRVPAFAWWDGERIEEHRLEQFIQTARMAMSRRECAWIPSDEVLIRALFEATVEERRAAAAAEHS